MENILRNFTILRKCSKAEKEMKNDICGERKPYADFSK